MKLTAAEKKRREGILRMQAVNMIGLVQYSKAVRELFREEPWLLEVQPQSFKNLAPNGPEAFSNDLYQSQRDWLALIPNAAPKHER